MSIYSALLEEINVPLARLLDENATHHTSSTNIHTIKQERLLTSKEILYNMSKGTLFMSFKAEIIALQFAKVANASSAVPCTLSRSFNPSMD